MDIHVDEDNLKHGVLGLVMAIVEIIRDALKIQALKRIESGSLNEEECERLGKALMDLDLALGRIKEEQGIAESVRAVRDQLDNIVDNVIDQLGNPERWQKESRHKELSYGHK